MPVGEHGAARLARGERGGAADCPATKKSEAVAK